MKKIFIFLMCMLFVCQSAYAAKDVYKIGVMLPLSGDMAQLGEDIRDGFLLAQEEARPQNLKYELIFEDDGGSSSKAVLVANKLLKVNKVDMVVCLWSNVANAVAPITEAAKIPMFGIIWDDSLAKRSKYVLTHETSATAYSTGTVQLIKRLGWKKVSILQVNAAGYQHAGNVLREQLKKENITLIADERINPGLLDARTLIHKLAQGKPDGVIAYLYPPFEEIFARQVKELGNPIAITGYFEAVKDLKQLEGVVFTAQAFGTGDFIQKFKNRYNHGPVLRSPSAYDIYNLVVKVNEAAGKKLSADELKAAIKGIKNYSGALGLLNADEHGVINSPVVFRQVKNGKLEEYKF